MTKIQMQTQFVRKLHIGDAVNVGHTTVRYRTVITQSHNDYSGEAEIVMREENRGVTLERSPHSDMKDACIKQCSC